MPHPESALKSSLKQEQVAGHLISGIDVPKEKLNHYKEETRAC